MTCAELGAYRTAPIIINKKHYWKQKKRLCVMLRSGDKHHPRKSADGKAQISPVSKTVAMVIAPHSRACQGLPTGVRLLLLQNDEVKLVSQTRLLGIIIDDSLSWSPHVDSICKKVGRKIGALRRTCRQLTPTARRQFFVSVIQPDLEYAASATIPFMPTGQQDRRLALWKKAVRCLQVSTVLRN